MVIARLHRGFYHGLHGLQLINCKKNLYVSRYTPEEKRAFEGCKGNLREASPIVLSSTYGVFALVLDCGIIVKLTPLYGSESLTQVSRYINHGIVTGCFYQ